jgi:tagaturonate reductase
LWVIEPKLTPSISLETLKKKLPLEKAGLQVRFVEDLAPYRTRKVRILNGAHTAMVPVGYLRGLRTVRECIEDPSTGAFIRKTIDEEIIPTLDLPKPELEQFAKDVIERFQNPFIRHELASIALNSISKYQVRVLPSVLAYIQRKGRLPENLLYSLAALILFYKGEWRGQPMPVNDTAGVLTFFRKIWAGNDMPQIVRDVLSNEELWKTDLTTVGITASLEKSLNEIMQA